MKINIRDEDKKNSLLGHIILNGLVKLFKGKKFEKFIAPYQTKRGHVFDIKLMLGDTELPLKYFIEHWQSQVERLINDQAKLLIEDKFAKTTELLRDLEEKLKTQLES